MVKPLPILFLFLHFASAPWGVTEELDYGTVKKVVDGDTIVFQGIGAKTLRVRLADIDTPELDQPWGEEAKAALKGWAEKRRGEIRIVDTDRYGRSVATLWIDDENINRKLVAVGHAWAYRRYLRDTALLNLEARAKEAQIGLWSNLEAIEPDVWRRRK